jgi:sugar lactone lactonase YvrE
MTDACATRQREGGSLSAGEEDMVFVPEPHATESHESDICLLCGPKDCEKTNTRACDSCRRKISSLGFELQEDKHQNQNQPLRQSPLVENYYPVASQGGDFPSPPMELPESAESSRQVSVVSADVSGEGVDKATETEPTESCIPAEKPVVKERRCAAHGQPLALFCKKDECLICVECVVTTHDKHQDFRSLNDAADETTATLNERTFVSKIQAQHATLTSKVATVVDCIGRLDRSFQQSVATLKDTFGQVREALDTREMQLRASLTSSCSGKRAELEELQSELLRLLAKLQTSVLDMSTVCPTTLLANAITPVPLAEATESEYSALEELPLTHPEKSSQSLLARFEQLHAAHVDCQQFFSRAERKLKSDDLLRELNHVSLTFPTVKDMGTTLSTCGLLAEEDPLSVCAENCVVTPFGNLLADTSKTTCSLPAGSLRWRTVSSLCDGEVAVRVQTRNYQNRVRNCGGEVLVATVSMLDSTQFAPLKVPAQFVYKYSGVYECRFRVPIKPVVFEIRTKEAQILLPGCPIFISRHSPDARNSPESKAAPDAAKASAMRCSKEFILSPPATSGLLAPSVPPVPEDKGSVKSLLDLVMPQFKEVSLSEVLSAAKTKGPVSVPVAPGEIKPSTPTMPVQVQAQAGTTDVGKGQEVFLTYGRPRSSLSPLALIKACPIKGIYTAGFGSHGDGNGHFKVPYDVCVSPDGSKIVVADTSNHRIQIFDARGNHLATRGSHGIGQGEFNIPSGVSASNDEVFVADTRNSRVQVLSMSGKYIRQWGLPTLPKDKECEKKALISPRQTCVSPTKDEVYVVDEEQPAVLVYKKDGTYLRSIELSFTAARRLALSPEGDLLYVVDPKACCVHQFSTAGILLTKWGKGGKGEGEFSMPWGIVCHKHYVLVMDAGNFRVQVFLNDGTFVKMFGEYGRTPGTFGPMGGAAITSAGVLYIADDYDRIQIFH